MSLPDMAFSQAALRRVMLRLMGGGALAAGLPAPRGQAAQDQAAEELPFALRTPLRVGQAALRVRGLERMIAFYRGAIGLRLLRRPGDTAVMGCGGVELLHLISRPDAPFEAPVHAGLFHIAFLMPDRMELARWLLHAARSRMPLTGFADHSVSEAIYLNDPEGNGLEIYSDRPPASWQWREGLVTMGTHPLDTGAILALAGGRAEAYGAAPDGMRIGHMHLRVGHVATGRAFYGAALGLDSTRGNDPRSAFLASGGYHHHVAINSWNSAGAGMRDDGTTGLDWFSLMAGQEEALRAGVAGLRAAAVPVREIEGGVEALDPWGTRLRLLRA